MTAACFTAADAYASAASALAHGRDQLAAELEVIGDQLAAREPIRGYVWECPYVGCPVAGLAATAHRAAEQYHEHYERDHRISR